MKICETLLILSVILKIICCQSLYNNYGKEEERDSFSFVGGRNKRWVDGGGVGGSYTDQRDMFKIIPPNYDIHELPPNDGLPLIVNVSGTVMDIRDINEMSEHISMEYKLKLYWRDSRLENVTKMGEKSRVLNVVLINRIWHPDVYFEHLKSIDFPSIVDKPASLRIYPGGIVKYSARMVLTVICPMDFTHYPADSQACNVDLQTYGFLSRELQLFWGDYEDRSFGPDPRGHIRLANYEDSAAFPVNFDISLKSIMGEKFTVSAKGTGDFHTGLRFTIILRRKISYHLLQTFLPSVIYIFVSWLSFILPLESTSERMGYCVTCLFTLTSTFGAVRQSTPNVAYIKALDIWMVACIFFVFLTLLQHATIGNVRRKLKKSYKKEKMKHDVPTPQFKETSFISRRNNKQPKCEIEEVEKTGNNGYSKNQRKESGIKEEENNELHEVLTAKQRIAKQANRYISFIIPILFLMFNCFYWCYILTVMIMRGSH